MTHTPGPWTVVGLSRSICGKSFDGVAREIVSRVRGGSSEAADANARLIAAAPDLLAACKELREGLAAAMRVAAEGDFTDLFVEAMARAGVTNGIGARAEDAIAKAEGHEPAATP